MNNLIIFAEIIHYIAGFLFSSAKEILGPEPLSDHINMPRWKTYAKLIKQILNTLSKISQVSRYDKLKLRAQQIKHSQKWDLCYTHSLQAYVWIQSVMKYLKTGVKENQDRSERKSKISRNYPSRNFLANELTKFPNNTANFVLFPYGFKCSLLQMFRNLLTCFWKQAICIHTVIRIWEISK